ncbi:hypothetical protein [Arthrobacter sp. MDT1-65]
MDCQAALDSLSEFLGDRTLNSDQLYFADMVVQQLTKKSVVHVGALYESPYSDGAHAGPESLSLEADVNRLVSPL